MKIREEDDDGSGDKQTKNNKTIEMTNQIQDRDTVIVNPHSP